MTEIFYLVEIIEHRQRLKIASLQGIAWLEGWIAGKELLQKTNELKKNGYGENLKQLVS